jgi:hypothetical protein
MHRKVYEEAGRTCPQAMAVVKITHIRRILRAVVSALLLLLAPVGGSMERRNRSKPNRAHRHSRRGRKPKDNVMSR